MAHPGFFLAVHPVGWAVLGLAGGYLAYKAGKSVCSKGEQADKEIENIEREGLADKVVKGAMKTVYRAKKKGEEVVADTKEKYSSMWQEAQDELKPDQKKDEQVPS